MLFDDDLFNSESSQSIYRCKKCGASMIYRGSGRYVCEMCNYEFLTDFGIIKKYLNDHGPSNMVEISNATGVSRRVIRELLKEGRIEVSQSSGEILHCLACGLPIRFGSYCASCAEKLKGKLEEEKAQGAYNPLSRNMDNDRMRFMNRDK